MIKTDNVFSKLLIKDQHMTNNFFFVRQEKHTKHSWLDPEKLVRLKVDLALVSTSVIWKVTSVGHVHPRSRYMNGGLL